MIILYLPFVSVIHTPQSTSIPVLAVVVVVGVGAVCPHKRLSIVSIVNLEGSFNKISHHLRQHPRLAKVGR